MDAQVERREAEPLTHRETLLIVFGVLLPTFMGSLDQTILASALPTIGRDLGDVHSLPWLITAYLLASTATIPLYGKIADIHGRRFTLRIAILIYLAGSLVCALAPNMLVLIFGRVLHGLGGGGLSSMGMIVLGDLVSPKERGRYYTYFSLTYTTAGGCGPALGGFIADHLHWSVIFWINIPMGLAALAITTSLLRRLPRHERPHRLDIVGAVLIVLASVSFMLALNTAGVRFPWTSPPILALLAVALLMGGFFVVRLADRARAADPGLDPDPSDRALRDRRQCLRLGLDHRAQHHPADLSARRDGALADQRGAEPHRVHGGAEHERRAGRPGARPRAALQAPADDRAPGLDRGGRDPGVARREHDAAVVRAAGDRDRDGLRAAAVADLGGDAERGAAAPARHLDRHHEFQPQPVRDHLDRGVRGDRGRRARPPVRRWAEPKRSAAPSSWRPRASRSRSSRWC